MQTTVNDTTKSSCYFGYLFVPNDLSKLLLQIQVFKDVLKTVSQTHVVRDASTTTLNKHMFPELPADEGRRGSLASVSSS